ncbi:MAG: ATP-binding cassette domain-containing protein [Acidimicrobiia bacterium]
MSAIHVAHVSFSYSSAARIVDDASFSLGPGWTGLVGANGSGKTTLLDLLAGTHPPDSGAVSFVPRRAEPVLCQQRVDDRTSEVDSLGSAWGRDAVRLRARLRLHPSHLDRWSTLSPGERKRWQIAAALSRSPDVLLLDEPSNHLDTEARSLLIAVLSDFGGAGIIVSHDRQILRSLTTRTLRIHRGAVELWNGSYETARDGWEARSNRVAQERDRLKRERKKTARRLADQRRVAQEKDAKRSRDLRSAGPRDLDTRGAVATGRHASGQRAGAREREVTRSHLESVSEQLATMAVERNHGGAIGIAGSVAPKEFVLRHDGPVTIPNGTELFSADVAVRRGDRIRIAGPNGAGKTTLVNTLLRSAVIPAERILVLPQETTRDESVDWLHTVRALPSDDRGRVLSLVSLFGSDPAALLASDLPSPGEARKLALALGMGTATWMMVLDEPTNHLDLPSIERLESALLSYPGAIVVITHDEDLAAAVTTATWTIDPETGLTQTVG